MKGLSTLTRWSGLAGVLAACGKVGPMRSREDVLRLAYAAFNERDIDAALALMHPDVDWPNAWEGGRVHGRAAVRDYWERQFEAISSALEPRGFVREPDGNITVEVHQVVHDAATGKLVSESDVRHRFHFEDDLVFRMEVLEPSG
jgi:ketosteroid isomerase-like protein